MEKKTYGESGHETVDYHQLDFDLAVHQHQIIECDSKKLCGSYSFKLDEPLGDLSVRFRYDADSETEISQNAFVVNDDGVSALIHGTYDKGNKFVRINTRDNFSMGPNLAIDFGMNREFEISKLTTFDLKEEDHQATTKKQGHSYLFPAIFCENFDDIKKINKNEMMLGSGKSIWLDPQYKDGTDTAGSCFKTKYFDKNGDVFYKNYGYARKNPVLRRAELPIKSPLQEAIQIPIILSYCQGAPYYKELVSKPFLKYQKFITGMDDAHEVDVCFQIGKEEKYAADLGRFITSRLKEEKKLSTSEQDYVIVAIFHEKLNQEFRQFHKITSKLLFDIIQDELQYSSPHLVGAFIYANAIDYEISAREEAAMMWCPQKMPEEDAEEESGDGTSKQPTSEQVMDDENCISYESGQIKESILNFTIPMGPFPSLSQYENHVSESGDKGMSRSPKLIFKSVPTNADTYQDLNSRITYFDNKRLNLVPGEFIHYCSEEDESREMDSFKFLPLFDLEHGSASNGMDDVPGDGDDDRSDKDVMEASLSIFETISLANNLGDRNRKFRIGMTWESPYYGALMYKSKVEGSIASIIPFQKTFKNGKILGDNKWLKEKWQFGRYLQICERYCWHPYFDRRSDYQVHQSWKYTIDHRCPESKIPEYQKP